MHAPLLSLNRHELFASSKFHCGNLKPYLYFDLHSRVRQVHSHLKN